MTSNLQTKLIEVYKRFSKHPNRVDAQLAFIRQVEKCLKEENYGKKVSNDSSR